MSQLKHQTMRILKAAALVYPMFLMFIASAWAVGRRTWAGSPDPPTDTQMHLTVTAAGVAPWDTETHMLGKDTALSGQICALFLKDTEIWTPYITLENRTDRALAAPEVRLVCTGDNEETNTWEKGELQMLEPGSMVTIIHSEGKGLPPGITNVQWSLDDKMVFWMEYENINDAEYLPQTTEDLQTAEQPEFDVQAVLEQNGSATTRNIHEYTPQLSSSDLKTGEVFGVGIMYHNDSFEDKKLPALRIELEYDSGGWDMRCYPVYKVRTKGKAGFLYWGLPEGTTSVRWYADDVLISDKTYSVTP